MNLRELPVLDGDDVGRLLPYGDLVDALEASHRVEPAVSRRVVFGPDGSSDSFLGLPAFYFIARQRRKGKSDVEPVANGTVT